MALIKSNAGRYFTAKEVVDYQQFLQSLKANDHYYVVSNENVILAAGGFAEHNQQVRMTWGMVHPDWQGQNIGSYLLQQRLLKSKDCYPDLKVALDTSQHTVGFYRRYGFRTLSRQMNGYAFGLDKIEMLRESDQPIESFEANVRLIGPAIQLELITQDDYEQLYLAASDPDVWAQHPASDRYKPEVFKDFFDSGIESGMTYLIKHKESGQVLGSSRYNNPDLDKGIIEIGWTFLIRSFWGGATNAELKHLMISHAFSYVDRVHFYIGKNNGRSIAAVKKLGAQRLDNFVDPSRPESVVFELTQDIYTGMNKRDNNTA